MNLFDKSPLRAHFPGASEPSDTGIGFESVLLATHQAGRRLAETRRAIEIYASKYPLTTLGVAFGLGVTLGWLLKRR